MVKEWGGGEMAGKGSHTHCGFFFFPAKGSVHFSAKTRYIHFKLMTAGF